MWRLALLAAVFLLFAVWSAYDGFYGYPRYNRIVAEARQYMQENSNWRETWEAYARQRGLPSNPQNLREKTAFDIYSQYAMLAITLPIGLAALITLIRGFSRWIAMDETGLITSWGQRVPFDQITRLDKQRWRNKGIAVVSYQDEGIERRLVLDDWKFETEPTRQLLRAVEAHLKPEQIVGDSPEAPPAAATDASSSESNAS